MKKFFSLVMLSFALVLTGCDDVQVSTGASWGVDRISYGGYYGRDWDYRGHMHRRQRYWRDYNDHYWGGRPGWHGNHGRNRHDWNHGGRRHGRPDWAGRHFVVETPAAPVLTKEDVAVYAKIGRVYGIGPKNSARVLESLNRAAVGDFGGLTDLGLNKNSLAAAKRNDGRLASAELDRLSRKLGVNQQKLDAMIQAVLGKR